MKNPFKACLLQQLRHPSGKFGRFLVRLLDQENASMNHLTMVQLDLQQGQHILEIGFGGGDLIQRLLNTSLSLKITGIDPSLASLAVSQKRFKQVIALGQLTFKRAKAEVIPFPDCSFDAIATVNTLYFWSNVGVVLQECRRVLKPGGKLAIAYNSKAFLEQNQMPQYGFRTYEICEIETQMQDIGFVDIKTISGDSVSNGQFLCTYGVNM